MDEVSVVRKREMGNLQTGTSAKKAEAPREDELRGKAATPVTLGKELEGVQAKPELAERVRTVGGPLIAHLVGADARKLNKEYMEMRSEADHLPQEAFAANKDRNRYVDIGCHDETRVVLQEKSSTDVGETYDYIHANFVSGPVHGDKEYICTQGPLSSTVDDFWKMVWEQGVCVIVMLCLPTENGKEKCAEYSANAAGDEKRTEAGLVVRTEGVERVSVGEHQIEERRLRLKGPKGERSVLQVVHVNWPDRGLPPGGSWSMVALCERIRSRHAELAASNGLDVATSPRVVHCSAGIGRSGTYVAIDAGLALLRGLDPSKPATGLSVRDLVLNIRRQRRQSIQNLLQYLFIYIVLAEFALTQCPDLATPDAQKAIANLQAVTKRLQNPSPAK